MMTAEDRIERLEDTVQRLLSDIAQLPDNVLYREPSPGEWPVMSTLAHLAELLPYWAHQAEGVATSPETSFGRTHADPQRLGAIEQHGHDSLDAAVTSIRAALDECVAILRRIPADAWNTVGQSPTRGTMTVQQIIDQFIVHHADEHCAQIKTTLSELRAAPR